MIHKIENEYLTIEINERGAELCSIKSKESGIEYLWQGDSKYWDGHSPVLFPICGRLYDGNYTFKGKEYNMPIHGIAQLFAFKYDKISKSEISFMLSSNEKTKKYYPFDFEFSIRYSLKANLLKTDFIVKNTGDSEIYFSYGGHPGFNIPFNKGDSFEDYYIQFSKNKLNKLVFSETCFYTNKVESYKLFKRKLQLQHNLFEKNGLFFVTKSGKLKLKSLKTKNSIEISYKDMTCIGIWHTLKSDAPFICIEPWHGVPSTEGVVDNLKEKQQMILLKSKKRYDNSYTIKIIESKNEIGR